MAFGRRNRPSLLRTATQAAVIGGAATAASNAVNARAAAPVPPAPVAAPAAAPVVAPVPEAAVAEDVVSRIERLAALHASGALTDAEFAALKSQAISG